MRKFINNYSMHNLLLGFKKAYNISFLHPKVEYYHNLLLVRIFRVIGGVCIMLILTGKYTLILEQLQILVFIFGFIHITTIIIIQIIKVVYGLYIYIKKPELFEVRNSPLNAYATRIAKLLACAKYNCQSVGLSIGVLAGALSIDTFLESIGTHQWSYEYSAITQNAIDLLLKNNPFESHFINGDSISSFLENLKIFISDLSFEELWAVAHICSSIFIFLLLFNIISIIYSDFLLNYLKIEEKFPKLGKIIKYRRIYQQYYLIINILFIIITLMATIFINYHILINFINT